MESSRAFEMDPCLKATADFSGPLAAFSYFLVRQRAVYVSAPINTGWHFLRWYRERGSAIAHLREYKEAHAAEVISINCKNVAETIANIARQEHPTPILDPTKFDVPGWTQDDFRCFWGLVIQKFVARVIFLNGWEASVGCVHEFRVATRLGVSTVDQTGSPIGTPEAVALIRRAIVVMDDLGLETGVFMQAISDLGSADTRAPQDDRQ